MAFVTVNFSISDSSKVVTYTLYNTISTWPINSAKVGADTIDATRWYFDGVAHDPTNSSNLVGTLHFNSANLDPNNPLDAPLLEALPNATLSFLVAVNGKQKPLTVYMNS